MTSTPKATMAILDSFVKLGDDVYVRDPRDDSGTPVQPSATIAMLFWMGASQRNAAKYLAEYIKLAPQARILFILTSPTHLFLRSSERSRRSRVVPAVETLLSSASSKGPLFFHIFSNGGALTLRHVAIAYKRAAGKPLPTRALLIDSAPGNASMAQTHKALSYSFPQFIFFRIMASVMVWFGLRFMRLIAALTRQKSPAFKIRQALNDSGLINKKAKRCYLYSETDDLIPWTDVEQHAAEAKDKGWEVTLEKFDDSPHVMHMRTDPKRYWNVVSKYLLEALA